MCYRNPIALLLSLLLSFAVGMRTTNAENSIVIDNFDTRAAISDWWISGSGNYYKGGTNRKGLSIVYDRQRRSNVLVAHISFSDPQKSEVCFISKNFRTPLRLLGYDKVTFWYRITTRRLSPTNALICRLRVSPRAFVDLVVALPETIRPGQWVKAELPIQICETFIGGFSCRSAKSPFASTTMTLGTSISILPSTTSVYTRAKSQHSITNRKFPLCRHTKNFAFCLYGIRRLATTTSKNRFAKCPKALQCKRRCFAGSTCHFHTFRNRGQSCFGSM